MDLIINQLFDKAINAYKKGNYEKAERFYKKVLEKQPANVHIYNNLGLVFRKQKKIKKANESFNKAINLNPKFAEPYYNLGNLFRDDPKYQDALKNYKKAISLNPNFVEAYYNIATILSRLKKYKEAIKNYKKVIELNPNYLEVKHIIASLSGVTTKSAPRVYIEKLFDTYANNFENSLINDLDYKVPKIMADTLINKMSLTYLGSVLDLGCGTGLVGLEIKKFTSKLVGVDLSSLMLKKAEEKNIYDELVHQDIKDYLLNEDLSFDYFIFADVFIYIGELNEIFKSIKLRNKLKGKLLFTIELTDKNDYFLEKSERYSHSTDYIEKLCIKYDYKILYSRDLNLRKENNKTTKASLYLLEF